MNTLYKVVLIVAFLLVVEAKHSKRSGNCSVELPNGFFCAPICQDSDHLDGSTVSCLISNDGEYHRFVARSPDSDIWRFYKVDVHANETSLCNITIDGDKFYSNKTDVTCTTPGSKKSGKSHKDDEKRISLQEMIDKVNEAIQKLFQNKKESSAQPVTEEEKEETAPYTKFRYALHRSDSAKKQPANENSTTTEDHPTTESHTTKKSHSSTESHPEGSYLCHLVTTDVCKEKKIISCEKHETGCCWAHIDSKACEPESLKKHHQCYKGLSALMTGLIY